MRMKTYQADTLEEAFRAIKAELGPDAVIIQTTHLRAERTLRHPFGRPLVQVQAAVEPPRAPASASPVHPREFAAERSPKSGTAAMGSTFRLELLSSLQEDDGWKDMVSHAVAAAPSRDFPDGEGNRVGAAGPARLRAELLERGCEAHTASRLVADAVAAAARHRSLSETALRASLHAVVAKRLRARATSVGGEERGRGLVVIGPTGAGKTLALSKLMTQYAQRGMRDLALVKVERERCPGIDPLQVTAGELGARVDVVRTPGELAAVLERRTCPEVVLVDTPGCSLLDRDAIADLRELCAIGVRLEVHLVLPAHTVRQDFEEMMFRYAGVPIHRLLFSKLDETLRQGRMLEIALRCGLPLSYLVDSQNPRGGIEVATPDRVASAVVGWTPDREEDSERWIGTEGDAGARCGRVSVGLCEGGHEWNRL